MENIDKELEEFKEGYGQVQTVDNLIIQIRSDEEFVNTLYPVSIVDTLEQRQKMRVEKKK